MLLRRIAAWFVVPAVLAVALGSHVSVSHVTSRPVAATIPSDRLHFGLGNSPADLGWMTSSGVPWKYRYQYLAGGVNTHTGWETWNSPTGAFASYYMDDSSKNHYIPVFVYYELLQSQPSVEQDDCTLERLGVEPGHSAK